MAVLGTLLSTLLGTHLVDGSGVRPNAAYALRPGLTAAASGSIAPPTFAAAERPGLTGAAAGAQALSATVAAARPGLTASATALSELAATELWLSQNLFSWFQKDNQVTASGRVVSFTDKVTLTGNVRANARTVDSAHKWAQATDDATHRVPAGGASFTGTQSYSSSIAATNWKFWHDGTGMMFFARATPRAMPAADVVIVSTKNDSVGGAGCMFYQYGVNTQVFLLSDDGTSFLANPSFGAVANNVTAFVDAQIKSSDTPDYNYRLNTASVETGDLTTGTPASVAPAYTCLVGYTGEAGTEVTYDIDELMWATVVDPEIRTKVNRYMELKYP